MNRRIHAWDNEGKIERYYNYFWLYLVVVCGASFISLYAFIQAGWVDFHTKTGWILALVSGSLLITTVNQVVIPGLNLLGHRGWYIGLFLATLLASLAAATTLVVFQAPTAANWVSGILTGQLILGAVGWRIFFRKTHSEPTAAKPTTAQAKTLLAFAWPISIAVGLGWTQTQSYRFMMESSLGLHALGIFAAGYGISMAIISGFETIFTTYLQPIFYKKISNSELSVQVAAWQDYAETIFPSLLLVGFFIWSITPELTRLILAVEYRSSQEYIGWAIIAELARVATAVFGMAAHARMKTKFLLVPNLVGALAFLILLYFLMPLYGSHGVGASLALASIASCLASYVATRMLFSFRFPRKGLFKSALFGVVLIPLSGMLRQEANAPSDMLYTVIQLCLVGAVFLVFQYQLLLPLLKNRQPVRG